MRAKLKNVARHGDRRVPFFRGKRPLLIGGAELNAFARRAQCRARSNLNCLKRATVRA
jgi:hypothetical protein